jgi:Fe-S-cluster-containing hydrogenase component 2
VDVCPVDAIAGDPGDVHTIDPETCIGCGQCTDACPVDAIDSRA